MATLELTTAHADTQQASQLAQWRRVLCVLFFFSGFPALIYQLTWQRALFRTFGVNIESVTIVVTAFMLGLGLGSLAGGWLSKRRAIPFAAAAGRDRADDRMPTAWSRSVFSIASATSRSGCRWQRRQRPVSRL